MKKMLFIWIVVVFIGCSREDHEKELDIIGSWHLMREVVVYSDDVENAVETKEVLYTADEIVYEFKKDNQLLIKRQGKLDLLMRYNCYSDLDLDSGSSLQGIQEFLDINKSTFKLNFSEGKLILDASSVHGSILYFERS